MSNKIVKYIVLFLLAALCYGCATMGKDECLHADWHIKGLEDASQGFPLTRIAEHAKACARVSVTPVMKDYEAGHKKGARLYCVPEKGYSAGRNGAAYQNICPPDLEDRFLRAYRDGQELFAIQRNINNLTSEIDNNQKRIHSDYDEIKAVQFDIEERTNDSNQRRNKLRRIDDLHFEITNLAIRNDRAIQELNFLKNDFRHVENLHYQKGYVKY